MDPYERLAGGRESVAAGVYVEEIALDRIEVIRALNTAIFQEERIINTFDREDLLMLLALHDTMPVGFKIGYRYGKDTFYSAKGGVLPGFRRQGIARLLLREMLERVRARGFRRFIYDTFPNKHPGMTVMGLAEGFRVVRADYNPVYRDYRLQLEKEL
jgi:GNAT superfamily N-acetyltransferase